jgi:type IV secretory pathway VirJ component
VTVTERARSNATHLRHLMGHLEALLATEAPSRGRTTSVVSALHDIAQRAHRRSLVVVFSDMLDGGDREDEVFDALQHLRFNRHDIILFHVVDRKHELDLDLQDRPYTFVDVETGQQVKAHPAEVRDAYKAAMAERWHRLKLKCGQYRIDLVEADINAGFEPLLLEFLTKRSKLY